MNFTREPIIETVITPREGCKLIIRSSKAGGNEEYLVDAVEVVSFGASIFFRSLERPKSFLLPVSDYEVIELKETRMVLKNATVERSIKIPGRTAAKEEELSSSRQQERSLQDHGRKRRSRRRRGGGGEIPPPEEMAMSVPPPEEALEKAESVPTTVSRLFPPPPTLIKETLGRYKDNEVIEANLLLPTEGMADVLEYPEELPPPLNAPPYSPLDEEMPKPETDQKG